MIFAFLSLAALGGLIDFWTPTKAAPLMLAGIQLRSLSGAPLIFPGSREHSSHVAENLLLERLVHADREEFPCELLEITASGAICDGYRLDFPKVNLPEVLDGYILLPRGSIHRFIPEKFVGAVIYRNLALDLRWEPATPEFLQIYLEEYLPYWGNRIPYRLFWDARYEICAETCFPFSDAGEFLPEDVEALSPSLAADINFNGVPAAFWNVNINP